MLSIRLQRVGRKGHAVYRIIVQEASLQPTSGKVVAFLGSYDPHTKAVVLDKDQAQKYLDNGAQPTPRVVLLLQAEKVKLPKWVEVPAKDRQSKIKNTEKLRRNQPAEAEVPAEEAPTETPAEEAAEQPVEEVTAEPAQEAADEAPVEAAAPTVEEADKSVEQLAEKEVEEGQVTAEEEVADSANEDSDQNASEDVPSEEKTEKA